MSLVREKKSQGIPSGESFEKDLYIFISKNACYDIVVNAVQIFTFRYHYKNSQADYTQEKKSITTSLNYSVNSCKSHIILFDMHQLAYTPELIKTFDKDIFFFKL